MALRKSDYVIFPLLARTTTTQASKPVNLVNGSRLAAFLRVSAKSGTNPTLNVKIQDSPDGENWFDIASGAFTEATNTGAFRLGLAGPFGDYVRGHATIGGTDTPTFTYELQINVES